MNRFKEAVHGHKKQCPSVLGVTNPKDKQVLTHVDLLIQFMWNRFISELNFRVDMVFVIST